MSIEYNTYPEAARRCRSDEVTVYKRGKFINVKIYIRRIPKIFYGRNEW